MADDIVAGVATLTSAIEALLPGRSTPVMVALDGRSGVGKSTLAGAVAGRIGAVVVGGDDFYGGGDAAFWDALTPQAKAAHCMDWRRQRPVLEALQRGQATSWQRYDWVARDGRLSPLPITCEPALVVILEGVYSARPELADLFDLRVLIDLPLALAANRRRLRDGDAYDAVGVARWRAAEDHFSHVMPPTAFDLVLDAG